MLSQARDALAHQPLVAFVDPDDRACYLGLLARLTSTGEAQSCELRMMGPEAPPRWVQLSTTASQDAQGAHVMRIVLVDISARRQAAAAEAALHLADQAQRNRAQFLSRVSHEFLTPLNAISGFAYLLQRDSDAMLTAKAREQLQHIHDASAHLQQMVTDLLDVSSAASGQLAMRITTVDVLAVLREGVRHVEAQALAAGVTVTLEEHDAGPLAVSGDATRLRQVVQNLLSNAIKYNRQGGQVTARVTHHDAYHRVHIADNGIGMTPAQLAALFQPFNRLGREAGGIQGTGLGLVITRDLVQAMGGQLSVRSEAGIGSEFLVDLLASIALPEVTASRQEGPLVTRPDIVGSVLCVEHDAVNRELIRSILARRPGVSLVMVETGAQCVEAARHALPDVLMVDHRLPDMAGMDLLKVLRQLHPHAPMTCLVVSAESSPDAVAQAQSAGASDYLAKPIDPGKMLSIIDALVGAAPDSTQG